MSEPAMNLPGDGADDGRGAGAADAVGELRDLDARGVVEQIVACRRAADAHEARLLALAVHFVDLHPVVPGSTGGDLGPGREAAGRLQAEGPARE